MQCPMQCNVQALSALRRQSCDRRGVPGITVAHDAHGDVCRPLLALRRWLSARVRDDVCCNDSFVHLESFQQDPQRRVAVADDTAESITVFQPSQTLFVRSTSINVVDIPHWRGEHCRRTPDGKDEWPCRIPSTQWPCDTAHVRCVEVSKKVVQFVDVLLVFPEVTHSVTKEPVEEGGFPRGELCPGAFVRTPIKITLYPTGWDKIIYIAPFCCCNNSRSLQMTAERFQLWWTIVVTLEDGYTERQQWNAVELQAQEAVRRQFSQLLVYAQLNQ